ncbi:MAG TPA: baseplate J/gp47 family protein [Gaiellaceae bacterium]|nr:baseplate J/gp47 family protein [Gaiellaceae bacterium]
MSAAAPVPQLDTRTYQDLVDEAIARIPVHNPEWTNFNRSDPGITLLELYAFLTESLLYRTNSIPERNRLAFLSLLGVPLQPASSARGIVTLSNDNGPQQVITLHDDIEVRAGSVPFRSELELDILPVESRAYCKVPIDASPQLQEYYATLYASYTGGAKPDATTLQLYQTTPLPAAGVDLATTSDRSLWIALLLRRPDGKGDDALDAARGVLEGATLSLGIVPILDDPEAQLSPLGRSVSDTQGRLSYQLPAVPTDTLSLGPESDRTPKYNTLDPQVTVNVLDEPGIVQLTLPDRTRLTLWEDVDPIEAGVGDLPPSIDDSTVAARVITWLRIKAESGTAKLLWAGINAVTVSQQARVVAEVLPNGTGAPDQALRLAHTQILPDTVNLTVDGTAWTRVDDLYSVGPEVPVPDLRLSPGAQQPPAQVTTAYTLDASTGILTFGDGLHGTRPPAGSRIRADYAYGSGGAGNVGAGAIAAGPSLPAGVKVTNPVRTWGGAEAETVAEGEKQITRYLQHRDRVVTVDDFDTIVRRTPGIEIGRVDVIPAFSPELAPSAPGDAAGAVTLMVIPKVDPAHPNAPQPDQPFLDAICDYIDPRRLVTTEVYLRGPSYKGIWISVGFDPVAGQSVAAVRDAIKAALSAFLAPLPQDPSSPGADLSFQHAGTGWPRLKSVVPLELLAVASRVPGVDLVRPVLVVADTATASADASDPVPMSGLELPLVLGLSVLPGDPLPIDQLRGAAPSPSAPAATVVPVPVIPDTC